MARAPLERLAAEDANLRAALLSVSGSHAAAEFGAVVTGLSGYWLAYSHLAEAASWIERALAMRERMPQAEQARLLIASAILSGFRGDLAWAEVANAEGLALSRSAGDAFDVAMALTSYGASRNQLGQFTEAAALLEEGRTVAESIADPRQRAAMTGRALANLSVTARGRGNFVLATILSEHALTRYRGLGFDLAETRTLMDLAGIAKDTGDVPLMVAHYQTCLAQTGERGDMRVVWVALSRDRQRLFRLGSAGNGRPAVRRGRCAAGAGRPGDVSPVRSGCHRARSGRAPRGVGRGAIRRGLGRGPRTPARSGPGHRRECGPRCESTRTRTSRCAVPVDAAGARGAAPACGRRNPDRDIAEALFIGPRTVSWHVSAILSKLGVFSRTQLAVKAHADGLI